MMGRASTMSKAPLIFLNHSWENQISYRCLTGGRKLGLTRKISTLVLLFCLLHAPLSFGWGNEGHTAVNLVAARNIPTTMPRFLKLASVDLAYLGPEPDRWRSPSEFALKNAQEADHFIDLERVDWLDPLPRGRYEFYRKLYEKRAATADHPDNYLPEHLGLQPLIT